MLHQFTRKRSHCEYRCSIKGNINIHVASVHDKNKPFICDKCDVYEKFYRLVLGLVNLIDAKGINVT